MWSVTEETGMYSFSMKDGGKEVVHNTNAIAWPELIDDFISFMRGCGYVFETEEVLEVFQERLEQIAEAENGD